MKLTNTLRTIALSGLGLLAGASTLTMSAQDAHAMSGTPIVMTRSRSTWINLELTDSIQVSGELSVRGKLGCTSGYICTMNNSDDVVEVVVRDASGTALWSGTLSVDNVAGAADESGTWSGNADYRTFNAKTGITAPGLYTVEASYAARSVYVEGGANPGDLIIYYSASTSATAVSFGCDESYPDESIDGLDQDCDLIDGLNEDGDGFASVEVGGTDCDDSDASIHPGAEDLYGDGVDQDCSGADGVDLDGDGFAASSVGGPDCDDTNPLFNPGALDEVGDDIDQNCDGLDGVDSDQDGYASIESFGSDCDDLEAMTNIGSADTVGDLVDNNCDGIDGIDADQDGHASTQSGGTDCDDSAATTYLGAADSIGDSVDSNCDGVDGADADRDGYASTLSGGTDCDDSVATTYLGAADSVGDAVDNNCDGIDGVDMDQDGHASTQSGGTDCDDSVVTTYLGAADSVGDAVDSNCDGVDGADVDGDGDASVLSGGTDCDDSVETTYVGAADTVGDAVDNNCDGVDGVDADQDGQPSNHSGGTDCDDANATIYTGSLDSLGDNVDSNCDGVDGVDLDQDGYRTIASGGHDCDDSDASINPAQLDRVDADEVDSNCDGTDGVDSDFDGVASLASGGQDCNDRDATVHPSADELEGDSKDSNCDGLNDPDLDADGVSSERDCDDLNASVYPGATELVGDGLDNNCDGRIDELYLDRDGDGFGAMDEGGTDCDDYNAEAYPDAEEILDDGIDQDCDGVDDIKVDAAYLLKVASVDRICTVVNNYKTVMCFNPYAQEGPEKVYLNVTPDFDGRIRDVALTSVRGGACALSDLGEVQCWDGFDGYNPELLLSLPSDVRIYPEATNLRATDGFGIAVTAVTKSSEGYTQSTRFLDTLGHGSGYGSGYGYSSGDMSVNSEGELSGPWVGNGSFSRAIPTYARLTPKHTLDQTNGIFGRLNDPESTAFQSVTREECGVYFVDRNLLISNPDEAEYTLPSLLCLPPHIPESVKVAVTNVNAGYGCVQSSEDDLLCWGDSLRTRQMFFPTVEKIHGVIGRAYGSSLPRLMALTHTGRLMRWGQWMDKSSEIPAQFK